ncbi:unnamed protein product [Toxocara canis]|uniref:VWFA domain-containing protein n=1 Tax=Toxocara canis TaxID=6265 RepID=A0A183TWE4_TOXCA|nr:unnamed protein product [Toxocara canis]
MKELPYFSGITATGAALNLSLEALRTRRPNVPTNVVVITDGFSYDIVDGPAEELHRLPNVRTFTVTVTDAWREYELQTIAGNPHRVFKGMGSVRDLVTALTSCSNGPRKGHILPDDSTVDSSLPGQPATATAATIETYAPSVTSAALKQTATGKPSKEADTIKSTPPNIKQETPTSLTSGSSSSSSEEQAKSFTQSCLFDLMIVLDASGSLQSRFQRQLELTIRLVDRLIIGPEDARVAVIKYAGPRKAKVVFPFSKYTDKESLEAALRKVGFIGGTTYTNEALQKADAELSGPDGRRSHASPIVIVFTDGFSHDDPEPGIWNLPMCMSVF